MLILNYATPDDRYFKFYPLPQVIFNTKNGLET